MIPYANHGRNSNIQSYEIGDDFIIVHFFTGYWKHYTYTNMSAGASEIQHMQSLAQSGQGLNAYITQNKPPYASKC